MHSWLRVCLVVQLFLVSSIFSGHAAAQGSPEGGDLLVPIAPCRILDTSSAATPPEPGATRQVDIRSHRCGKIVPSFAKAFAVRVTKVSRQAPEKLPPGVGPITESVKKVPAPADGRMNFPAPPEEIVGVDVVGYYVPAGTPLSPGLNSRDSAGAPALKASGPSNEGPADIVHSGDLGNIFLFAITPPATQSWA